MKKKFWTLVSLLCATAMCLPLAACGGNNNGTAKAVAYVSMDINPSIEFTLDKNNKVISVYGANEDGQVLLYKESGIIGADIENAVEKVTNLAIELGYLDENNTVVQTSVTANSAAEKLLEKVNAKITATANGSSLSVTCDGAEAYSLLRKFDNIKAQYPDNAAIQALTPEKLKLVISASETGKISLEAAAESDTSQLLEFVSDAHKEAKEYATAAYNKAKAAADGVYEKAVSAAVDGIYTAYYAVHHPLNAYYGLAYQGYKTTATAMRVLSETLFYAERVSEEPLNERQIAAVSKALGLGENVDALKNSDGEITVKSIEAYADKLFKNSQTAVQLEDVKQKLTAALNSAENEIRTKTDEASKKYENEISVIKESLITIADGIKNLENLVPATVKEQITVMLKDFGDIAKQVERVVSDGKITADEVRTIADSLNIKSEEMLKKIESDLTANELKEVKDLQQKALDALTDAKAKFDQAVTKAETEAKQRLEDLKNTRVEKR